MKVDILKNYWISLTFVLAMMTSIACPLLGRSHTAKPQTPKALLKRPYADIEKRIKALRGVQRKLIGKVKGTSGELAIDLLTYPPETSKKKNEKINILLSGGAHGDEPAGTYALLDWLENGAYGYAVDFRFYVIPAINPGGIELDQANNLRGDNVNRQFFDKSTCPESVLVRKMLKKLDKTFLFTIDMHEIPPYWADEGWKTSDNPRNAYLYETQINPKLRLGRKMIDQLPKDIGVCAWKSIYGDRAAKGVITYPEDNGNAVYAKGTTFDAYLHGRYTKHSFTNETPTGWPLKKRIRAHLSWLKTALTEIRHNKPKKLK
jgi:hypothetical protein